MKKGPRLSWEKHVPQARAGEYPDPWFWLPVKHFALDLVRYFVSCMQAFLRIQLVAT